MPVFNLCKFDLHKSKASKLTVIETTEKQVISFNNTAKIWKKLLLNFQKNYVLLNITSRFSSPNYCYKGTRGGVIRPCTLFPQATGLNQQGRGGGEFMTENLLVYLKERYMYTLYSSKPFRDY